MFKEVLRRPIKINEVEHTQTNVYLPYPASQPFRAETKATGTEISAEGVKWTKIICRR